MPKTIEFPQVPPRWVFDRDCVAFPALVDGQPVRCLITMEALMQDHGARSHHEADCIQAFQENRSAIETKARKMMLSFPFPVEGEVLIKAAAPAHKSRIHFEYGDALKRNAEAVRTIAEVDETVISRYALVGLSQVDVYWELLDGKKNLFEVRFEDKETGVSAVQWFLHEQLLNKELRRERLDKVWAELLRARNAKQLAQLREEGL